MDAETEKGSLTAVAPTCRERGKKGCDEHTRTWMPWPAPLADLVRGLVGAGVSSVYPSGTLVFFPAEWKGW